MACSGGIDSVVLAHLCYGMELDFTLVHCNFKLRGAASDGDEHFVKQLAVTLKKPFLSRSFDTAAYMKDKNVSLQMAARELRYAWFNELLEQKNTSTLVTAHHADDNLETFIINLSRGTGIQGLTGIPAQTRTISRPLLPFSREQIKEYAVSEGIDWREDSSNRETKYLRNKIRHEILPGLKKLHPTFLDNFKRTQEYLKQTSELMDNHLEALRKGLFMLEEDITTIAIASLKELQPLDAYLYGLFGVYGFTEWSNVKELLSAVSGKEVRSKTHRLIKDRDRLLLIPIGEKENSVYYINESDSKTRTPLHLIITEVDGVGETASNVLYVDKETLKYPLELRKRREGDYFYPMGMKGRKKLSKYFKDEKFNTIAKEQQWLLCSEGNIVWVIGKRPDERNKVSSKTTKILKIIWNVYEK